MTLRDLMSALQVRFDAGEGRFEVQTRDETGKHAPTRLLIQTDPKREVIHIDAWERAQEVERE